MRPTYENSESLKAEEQTIRKAAEVWKSTYVKLPIQYRVDWALLRGGVVAWCECKRRYNNKDKYPTLMLSLNKIIHGMELARATEKPFLVVVEWNDVVGWHKVEKVHGIGMGGRVDRGDWQDIEPVVHIPVTDFKQLTK
jgi:hypothetical protein